MITSRFINFFLIFILIEIIFIVIINFKFTNVKVIPLIGCLISLMIITSICFFPIPYDNNLLIDLREHNYGVHNNFIPFTTIYNEIKDIFVSGSLYNFFVQAIGNILLFTPLGFTVYFYLEKRKRLLKSCLIIAFVSISIESFQAFFNYAIDFNYRSVDIDDIILNCSGGLIGYVVAKWLISLLGQKCWKKD